MGLKCEIKENVKRADAYKVYYCCHYAEYNGYLHTIKEILLDLPGVECAVYYDEKPKGKKSEEWNELLLDMNVFVVVVTRKFLSEDNLAKKEFLYARKQGIPVIPIVMDKRLMNAFNQISSGLHALGVEDLSYSSKCQLRQGLTAYMNTVLIHHTLLQRIHAVSEGHLFLSYRKKDRKHLMELINRIREDDRCMDIPIWYDDFLIPGERFDDQIEEKLKDGSIFILTVTPNLIREKNYVLEIEYKMAGENNKPIVPVEMVSTNKEVLEKLYPKIPKCINKEEREEIVESLFKILMERNVEDGRAKISEVERNYLIGMGYLTGTDREKNIDRALGKILSVANVGYIEAQKELVRMYKVGDGVEQDFAQAISWQRELIERIKEKEVQDLDNLEEYFNQGLILADLLVRNLQREEAKEVYKEIIAVTEGVLLQENNTAKEKLKELERTDEIMKKQEEDRKEIMRILNSIAVEKEEYDLKEVNACVKLAEQAEELNVLDVAKAAYEKAYNMAKKGVKVFYVEDLKQMIVNVLYRLAKVCMNLGEYDDAEKYLKIAYNSAEDGKIWGDESESKYRMEELVCTMSKYYGTCVRDSAGYSEAIKWINKALEYSEELFDAGVEGYGFIHIENLRYKGGLLELLGNYDAAEKVYSKEILNLLENVSDIELLLEKAYVYDDLGNVYEAKMCREYTEALRLKAYEYYNEAYEIREKLLKEEDISGEWLNKVYKAITFSRDNLGRIGMLDKDQERGRLLASAHYIKNVELCEKLYEMDKMDRENVYNLFYAYIRVVELNINLDREKAKNYFEKAKELVVNTGLDKQPEIKNIIEMHQTNYFA